MGTSPCLVSGDRGDRDLVAGQLAADRGRLQQGEAALAAAAGVHGHAVPLRRVEELALDQVDEVIDVEEVADLLAMSPEPDVGERVAEVVGEHPVGEYPLVDLSHLPGPGDHAEAVDHGGDAEGRPVLLDQELGGELRRPVERPRALQREVLGDPGRGDAAHGLPGGQLEAGRGLLETQVHLGRHRVDPAGREEDEEGGVAPRQLEAVVGAGEVRVDEVAGVAVDAAHHRGLRRALDQRVQPLHLGEVPRLAHVTFDEPHPRLLHPRQVQPRAAPVEVVECDDLPVRVPGGEGDCEVRADESRPAGDQDAPRQGCDAIERGACRRGSLAAGSSASSRCSRKRRQPL